MTKYNIKKVYLMATEIGRTWQVAGGAYYAQTGGEQRVSMGPFWWRVDAITWLRKMAEQ